MPFELRTRVGRRKHKFNRICQVAPICPHERAHCRHLANTIEPSIYGGDAPYVKLLCYLWPRPLRQSQMAERFEPNTALWAFHTIQPSSSILVVCQTSACDVVVQCQRRLSTSCQRTTRLSRKETSLCLSATSPASRDRMSRGTAARLSPTRWRNAKVRCVRFGVRGKVLHRRQLTMRAMRCFPCLS